MLSANPGQEFVNNIITLEFEEVRMKRFPFIVLVAALLFCFVACTGSHHGQPSRPQQQRQQVHAKTPRVCGMHMCDGTEAFIREEGCEALKEAVALYGGFSKVESCLMDEQTLIVKMGPIESTVIFAPVRLFASGEDALNPYAKPMPACAHGTRSREAI